MSHERQVSPYDAMKPCVGCPEFTLAQVGQGRIEGVVNETLIKPLGDLARTLAQS
jgi:hypothetical protein